MQSDDLRRRMEALNGRPLDNVPAAPSPDDAPEGAQPLPPVSPASLAEALPGNEREAPGGGTYYLVERCLADDAPWAGSLAHRVRAALASSAACARLKHPTGVPAESALFLDLETMGLDREPIFMVGTLVVQGANVLCRHALARSPAEESAILRALSDDLSHARVLISFNGIDFDLRLAQARARVHGTVLPAPRSHVDVLVEARRRIGRRLPNCRLQTLEERVCGRTRVGDVPGARIPAVYEAFTRTGDASMLAVVAHHNLLDLATTADLFSRFFAD